MGGFHKMRGRKLLPTMSYLKSSVRSASSWKTVALHILHFKATKQQFQEIHASASCFLFHQ